ncbi:MAG: hypothetical protein K2K17_01515 [Lachnospiraceae bacterium]|nr:hypothetical protein [Lachnospiraceae bacterium]
MSKVYRISLICVMVLAMFTLCILLYRYEERDVPYVEYSDSQNLPSKKTEDISYPGNDMPEEQEDVTVTADAFDVTTADTELIIVENYPGGLRRQSETTLPAELVGRNRNDLDELLESYCSKPDSIDIEKGLYRLELTVFSAASVTIEKSYHNEVMDYYYLGVADDCVTVYREDKRTVLLTTDIHRDQLTAALVEEILNFKLIVGNAELFDFLETYTS